MVLWCDSRGEEEGTERLKGNIIYVNQRRVPRLRAWRLRLRLSRGGEEEEGKEGGGDRWVGSGMSLSCEE